MLRLFFLIILCTLVHPVWAGDNTCRSYDGIPVIVNPDNLVISGDQTICSSQNADLSLTSTPPVPASGNHINYIWEKNTTGCGDSFESTSGGSTAYMPSLEAGVHYFQLRTEEVPDVIFIDTADLNLVITPESSLGANDGSIFFEVLASASLFNSDVYVDLNDADGNKITGRSGGSTPTSYTFNNLSDLAGYQIVVFRFNSDYSDRHVTTIPIDDLRTFGSTCTTYSNCATVTVTAIEPSYDDPIISGGTCNGGIPSSLAMVTINNIVGADEVAISSPGSFGYDGPAYSGVSNISGGTANLSGLDYNSAYILRFFDGSNDCYKEILIGTGNDPCAGTVTADCNCTEYLYLNDRNPASQGLVHKFEVGADGSLTEIGAPWFGPSYMLPNPHGLTTGLNGFIYIASNYSPGRVSRFTCGGDLVDFDDVIDGSIGTETFNFFSRDGVLYVYDKWNSEFEAWDLCTGLQIGGITVNNSSTGRTAWGLYIDDTDWYLTFQSGDSADHGVWSGSLDLTNFTSPPTTSVDRLFALPNRAMGITRDDNDNFYIVLDQNINGTSSAPRIVKYDANGTQLASITANNSNTNENVNNGETGFWGVRGLVFSESTGLIYASNFNNCITVFNTSLVEQTALNIGNPEEGIPKGITITKECCPGNTSITIDTTLCAASIGDTLFLQNLIDCKEGICEGLWEEGTGNTGLTYNSCNNSLVLNSPNSCGSFTLSSDELGNNPQCGAFKITVNVAVENVTAPVISGNQPTCANNNDPALIIDTPASGSQTITYTWQSSTTDCNTGWSDITSAPTDGTPYDPPVLAEETHFRVITSVNGTCSSVICADTSNCVTLTPEANCCTNPILTALTDESICEGGSFTSSNVTTSVTNGVSVTYQWFDNNGTDNAGIGMIAGQTSATLTALPTAVGSYSYRVVATNTVDNSCTGDQTVNLTINSNPTVSASISQATCVLGSSTANSDGTITLSGFTTETYDMVTGSSYTGSATFATATAIPSGGEINNLANPSGSQDYTIRIFNSNGCYVDRTVIIMEIVCAIYDWGDLPDSGAGTSSGNYETQDANTGPSHQIISGLNIGSIVDEETDGQPSIDALGDDTDEDGFSFPNTVNIVPGGILNLPIDVINTTGTTAHYEVWIDWNGDGDFNDPNEMVADLSDDGAGDFGQSYFTVNIPEDATTDQLLGFRPRLSHTDNMTPYGQVDAGEVEDYLIMVKCKDQICLPIKITIKRD